MTDDNKRANITQELLAARRHLEAAERVGAISEYEAAVNRLYYAVLHAARAVCLTEGRTLDDLRAALLVERFDIVHLTGHGIVTPEALPRGPGAAQAAPALSGDRAAALSDPRWAWITLRA